MKLQRSRYIVLMIGFCLLMSLACQQAVEEMAGGELEQAAETAAEEPAPAAEPAGADGDAETTDQPGSADDAGHHPIRGPISRIKDRGRTGRHPHPAARKRIAQRRQTLVIGRHRNLSAELLRVARQLFDIRAAFDGL